MSSVNSKLAQAIFPLLTVTLLSVGCEDSTAPSSGETPVSQPAAQPPTGPSNTSDGSGQTPTTDTGEAPKVDWPAPGDTAGSSQRPSLATVATAAPTAVAKAGWISPRGVTCAGASLARQLTVNSIFVGRSTGYSYYLDQRIVMKAWFYRYNANTKTWDPWPSPAVSSLDLPANGSFGLPMNLSGDLPLAWYKPTTAGYYRVVAQLFWYAKYPQGFVQTTSATVYFDSASDYLADSQLGSAAGPYYCYIN